MDHRRGREVLAEAKVNGGDVFDPVPRGMKPRRFNMEIEELREWIEQKVLEHREGNGLTAPGLCRLLQAEYPVQCPTPSSVPVKQVGRALRRLGFRYRRREKCYISYRKAPEDHARPITTGGC